MKINRIFGCLASAALLSVGFLSCSEDDYLSEKEQSQLVSLGDLTFQIGAYPSGFSNGLRVAGEPISGKTEWKTADKVEVRLTCRNPKTGDVKVLNPTLYYDGVKWKITNSTTFASSPKNMECYVSAVYVEKGVIVSSENGAKEWSLYSIGVGECFVFNDSMTISSSGLINIDFSNSRCYSRIRAYAGPNVPVVLKGEFKANGLNVIQDSVVVEADNDGSAYFYGSWDEGAQITLNGKPINTASASENGRSYAVDVRPAADVNGTTIECAVGAAISAQNVAAALEAGRDGNDFRLTVVGEANENQLEGLLDYISEYFDDKDIEEPNFTLDLSDLALSDGQLPSGLDYEYVRVLYLPRILSYVQGKAVNAVDMADLYVYDDYEFESGNSKKNAFIKTSDCTLHLPSSFEGQVDSNEWFNTVWRVVVTDLEF